MPLFFFAHLINNLLFFVRSRASACVSARCKPLYVATRCDPSLSCFHVATPSSLQTSTLPRRYTFERQKPQSFSMLPRLHETAELQSSMPLHLHVATPTARLPSFRATYLHVCTRVVHAGGAPQDLQGSMPHVRTPAARPQSSRAPCLHVATSPHLQRAAQAPEVKYQQLACRAAHLHTSTARRLQYASNAPSFYVCTPAAR